MEIGITGWPFRGWQIQRSFQKIREYGIHYLDFWPEMRGVANAETIRRLAEDAGLVLFCYNVPDKPRLGSWNSADAIRAGLTTRIAEAESLGIHNVQFYGSASPGRKLVDTVNECVEVLKPVLEYAERTGVTLWFENDYDESGTDRDHAAINRTPEALKALIDSVNSARLKVTFDTCNFMIAGCEGFPFGYELLRPHISNVHIKDARRYEAALLGNPPAGTVLTSDVTYGTYMPVTAGRGAANLGALLRAMNSDGFEGFITLDALCHGEQADHFFPQDLAYVRRCLEGDPVDIKEEIRP